MSCTLYTVYSVQYKAYGPDPLFVGDPCHFIWIRIKLHTLTDPIQKCFFLIIGKKLVFNCYWSSFKDKPTAMCFFNSIRTFGKILVFFSMCFVFKLQTHQTHHILHHVLLSKKSFFDLQTVERKKPVWHKPGNKSFRHFKDWVQFLFCRLTCAVWPDGLKKNPLEILPKSK